MGNTVVRTILRDMAADSSTKAADASVKQGIAPKGEMKSVAAAATGGRQGNDQ